MRYLLLTLLLFTCSGLFGQDKIYLNDNSVVEGKIWENDSKNVKIRIADGSILTYSKKDVALIILADESHEVPGSAPNNDTNLPKWMVGTNILTPLDALAGFMIERNLTKHYSIRVGQAFSYGNFGLIESYTSLLNNFYFGKGTVKFIADIGINLYYQENQYYYPILYSINDLAYPTTILPYPPEFHPYIEPQLTFGVGVYISITKHLGFTTQLNLVNDPFGNDWEPYVDIPNSGFSFFYKF